MEMANEDSDMIFYGYHNVLLEWKCPTTMVTGLYRGVGSEDKAELNRLVQQTKLSNQPEWWKNSSHQHSLSVGLKAA